MFNKCHHNIIFGKVIFKIPLRPPTAREVWNYGKANVEDIQRSISSVDWDFLKELPFIRKLKS